MLFLDGVYTNNKQGKTRFQSTMGPNQQELNILVHTISHRVALFLERQGVPERDEENSERLLLALGRPGSMLSE